MKKIQIQFKVLIMKKHNIINKKYLKVPREWLITGDYYELFKGKLGKKLKYWSTKLTESL